MELRWRIACLILRAFPELERRGTYWAKLNLVHCCRALNLNTRARAYDNRRDTWLTYCLLPLRDAFLPKEAYDENYVPRERDIDLLRFEEAALNAATIASLSFFTISESKDLRPNQHKVNVALSLIATSRPDSCHGRHDRPDSPPMPRV
jgi:hypothetical protein